jgi:hypothetical protein
MKTASILLALIVVLGFVSEAEAGIEYRDIKHKYTVRIAGQDFGFKEFYGLTDDYTTTLVYLGPLGARIVPFNATHGLIGFCFILALLIIVPAVLTVRWKKKRLAR